MKADRRNLLIGLGGLSAAAAAGLKFEIFGTEAMAGTLGGADMGRGHRLRDGALPPADRTVDTRIVIAGGGVAGLAAGWTLSEAGFDDFRLLELEDHLGGNARSGRNAVSAFPLGAHYLPVANREARALQHLLRRLNMIVGDRDGAPVYDPLQLCADLQERLFWQGRWQEGLIPHSGLDDADRAELDAFAGRMADYGAQVGSDGKPAFALPIAYSSCDPDLVALDAIAFSDWVAAQGWRSPVLLSHLRYCMRDDYGCEPGDVSAWAGIHYFAGRRGWAADGAGDNLLTWPEGNDRLAAAMASAFPRQGLTGQIVHAAGREGERMLIDSFDVRTGRTTRYRAEAAILALPHFIAHRLAPQEVAAGPAHSYAPWIVANVTVDRLPAGRGVPIAWDNLSYTSESLGYVVSTHQGPAAISAGSVLTWYLPLSREAPAAARRRLVETPVEAWQAMVRDDLLQIHPELDGAIRSIDVWRWGHAMIRPTPGFIWTHAPQAAQARPPLFLAHSDLSGLSLFEEAHYHGTRAGEAAMAHLGHAFETLL